MCANAWRPSCAIVCSDLRKRTKVLLDRCDLQHKMDVLQFHC
jgi:hypothetical protein